MSRSINHECTRVPVTALSFCNQFLFAAEGPFLQVFHHDSSKLLTSHQIFRRQSVHGILVCSQTECSTTLLLYGGCYVCLVRLCFCPLDNPGDNSSVSKDPAVHLSRILKCPDWVLDLSLAPISGSLIETVERRTVAAITAHNALLQLNLEYAVSGNPIVDNFRSSLKIHLAELTASSRCILYSAHLIWASADQILIAAGTAFGEILVWSWSGLLGASSRAQLHHVFTGHEGSVFGVQISGTQSLKPDTGITRLLASCSDDRSIRIWDISELPVIETLKSPQDQPNTLQIRETGFGANLPTAEDSTQLCLAISWGHASRVWSVQFLIRGCIDGHDLATAQIISTGEDATSRIWDLINKENDNISDASTLPFNLKEIGVAAYHIGKNMWSLALSYSRDKLSKIGTGAADGKIIMYCPSTVESDTRVDRTWALRDIVGNAQPSQKADIFRSYSFIDHRTYLLTTNEGKIITMQMKSSQSPTQVVEQPDQGDQAEKNVNGLLLDGSKFFGGEVKTAISSSQKILAMRGYSVSAGLVSHRLAIFAGATGDVYAIAESSSPCLIYLAKRKVAGIFPHRALHEDSDGEIHLLVCPVGMLTAELLLLRGPKLGVSNFSGSVPTYEHGSKYLSSVPVSHHASRSCYSVVEKVSIPLPVSPNFIVTSMVLAYTHGVYYMFVGARSGVVALFQLSHSSSASTSNNTFQPLLIVALHNVHGKEAVTSMLWNPSEVGEASASTGYLITAGRDGSCAAHEVNLENGNHTLVHKTNLPFGPNIEALYIRDERLMVYGFRSTQFVVVDESGEEDVMTVECGGAHRNWAFNPSSPGPGGTLVWTQAGKMRICHRAERSHEVLRSGGHGREIKAIAISPRIANEQGNYTQLIATGAEDTNIKIFEYTSSGSTSKSIYKLRCLRTLRKHMTGIQHLAWSEDGRYLFSSGGREEFFIWRIRLLPIIGVGAVCEAVCESENDVADLRIMSFAVHNDGVQNETSSKDMFVISMAYSDSTIRIYSCTPSSPSPWLLLNTGTYLTSCITQCVFLSLRTILTSGTDGHIAFWDPSSDQLAHTSRTKIHQNSAKTLAYRVLSPSTILLVTGGDDGALGVTLIRFSTASLSHNVSTLLLPRAHAAAMTACAVVSSDDPVFDTQSVSGRPLALQLVTSGTDQRVFLWDVLIDESKPGVEGLEVKRVGRADTAVADVADLALLDLGEGTAVGVVVCGVGMEVFRVGSLRTC